MKRGPHAPDQHDLGLAYDLSVMFDRFDRRRTLKLLAGLGALTLVGCASGDDEEAGGATSTTAGTTAGAASQTTSGGGAAATATTAAAAAPATTIAAATGGPCTQIPTETAGPFPGDGSQGASGANVLNQSGVVRGDLTSSFGSMSGSVQGVPLTVNLTVVDDSRSCAGYANAAVYLWHCDAVGNYSLYSSGVTNQNWLRGVQEADGRGVVSFKTIFPGAYQGRYPHIHFEVFPNLSGAASVGNKVATSQLALPEDACNAVYATSGYTQSARNFPQTPLARDNVFSDGSSQQVATVTGSVGSGFVASLRVPV